MFKHYIFISIVFLESLFVFSLVLVGCYPVDFVVGGAAGLVTHLATKVGKATKLVDDGGMSMPIHGNW